VDVKSAKIVDIEKIISSLLPQVLDGRMEMSDAKLELDLVARRVLRDTTPEERQAILAVAHKASNIGDGFFAQIQESIASVSQK